MSPKAVPGKQYDAALHLLDRQLLDPDGELVGKVDDLELSEQDGDLVVSAILTGPAALGPRFRGRLGQWVVAIWHRLRPDEHPTVGRIDFSDVERISSAVHVTQRRDQLRLDGFEVWVGDHIIDRIPGASHEPE